MDEAPIWIEISENGTGNRSSFTRRFATFRQTKQNNEKILFNLKKKVEKMNFHSNSLQLFPDSVRETLQSILSLTSPIGYLIIGIIMKKLKSNKRNWGRGGGEFTILIFMYIPYTILINIYTLLLMECLY